MLCPDIETSGDSSLSLEDLMGDRSVLKRFYLW